ncbi:MAG: sodium:alanine symporter family protein [Lachnospiraceae bacterium]|nr:sodium:alanine symporter family protein [Lachnospiraceae bacterium]
MKTISFINNFLWGFPLLFLLMGTHLYFTFRLGFPQRHIGKALRFSLTAEKGEASQHLSAFGILATTLAATLGTGNIIGVSTAVALGGPGAVFWCWITGILGMATSYAECYLSVIFREKDSHGLYVGGPMYVMKNGMHSKKLAGFYAFCTLCAAFGVGCTTQANSLTQTTTSTWGLSPHLVGMAAAFLVGLIILGGVRSIGQICTRLVPFLGFLYISGCLLLLFIHREVLPDTICLILKHALMPQALAGGVAGQTLGQAARYGISRGLFTNEAGIGTTAIAAASSSSQNPSRQAYVSMTAVFWDTVVMCLLSGLVIVANSIRHPESLLHINEAGLANAAFSFLPIGGQLFLPLALTAFALTTLIGWSYFGEKAFGFLWGEENIGIYKLIYIVMIYIGAVIPLDVVWECTDLINALMVVPNVVSLFWLRKWIQKSP